MDKVCSVDGRSYPHHKFTKYVGKGIRIGEHTDFCVRCGKPKTSLSFAVLLGQIFTTGIATAEKSYFRKFDKVLLEVKFEMDTPGCGYLMARVVETNQDREFRRLEVAENNTFIADKKELKIRVYRSNEAARAGRNDFNLKIDTSKMI